MLEQQQKTKIFKKNDLSFFCRWRSRSADLCGDKKFQSNETIVEKIRHTKRVVVAWCCCTCYFVQMKEAENDAAGTRTAQLPCISSP